MRLLERYILAELIRVFCAVLGLTTCLMVFVGVFEKMREHGLGPWQVVQILPYIIPSLLPYTIPVTLLLTVCVVYGRLAGDREIIAAKAAGIHVLSLLWPSYFLGAVLSVGSLLLMDQVNPWSFSNIGRVVTLAMEDIFLDLLRTQNQFHLAEQGLTITVMDVRDRTLIFPTFRLSPNGRNAVTIQAEEAGLQFDLQRQEVILKMKHGFIETPGQTQIAFAHEEKAFPLQKRKERLRPRNLEIAEIREQLAVAQTDEVQVRQRQAIEAAFVLTSGDFSRFRSTGFDKHRIDAKLSRETYNRLLTEMHNRFASSCSCFFFVLVGSPFAVVMARKDFLTSFLFCFLPILVFYYPISMMTQNMSKTGQLDPVWAVWIANGLMLAAATYFFRRVVQN